MQNNNQTALDNLISVKPLSWSDAFAIWREGEAHLPHWIEHFQERGFASWDDWRKHTIADLQPESLQWCLYEIQNPLATIPLFHGGPFRSWIKNYYGDSKLPTFNKIVTNQEVQTSAVIQEMIANFPAETTLVGLHTDIGVVIIEGLHRCCALAFAADRGIPIQTKVNIVLAEYLEREVPIMGQVSSPGA